MTWEEDQEWEKEWWNSCINTWGEEQKQRHYAIGMGLTELSNSQFSFFYDAKGRSILDIGGGPVSLLLKCVNIGYGKVIDPLKYPYWIKTRYKQAEIDYELIKGEDLEEVGFDEVWIYNVLQHVIDPFLIIQNAQRAGKIIRLFEWLEIGEAPGHPHNLLEEQMNEWLKGFGRIGESGGGKEYSGVFLGDSYEAEE
jgi:hypothetical protein